MKPIITTVDTTPSSTGVTFPARISNFASILVSKPTTITMALKAGMVTSTLAAARTFRPEIAPTTEKHQPTTISSMVPFGTTPTPKLAKMTARASSLIQKSLGADNCSANTRQRPAYNLVTSSIGPTSTYRDWLHT